MTKGYFSRVVSQTGLKLRSQPRSGNANGGSLIGVGHDSHHEDAGLTTGIQSDAPGRQSYEEIREIPSQEIERPTQEKGTHDTHDEQHMASSATQVGTPMNEPSVLVETRRVSPPRDVLPMADGVESEGDNERGAPVTVSEGPLEQSQDRPITKTLLQPDRESFMEHAPVVEETEAIRLHGIEERDRQQQAGTDPQRSPHIPDTATSEGILDTSNSVDPDTPRSLAWYRSVEEARDWVTERMNQPNVEAPGETEATSESTRIKESYLEADAGFGMDMFAASVAGSPESQDLHLSIGTIQLTVEEPQQKGVQPLPSPAPKTVPSPKGSTRLNRRYLRTR